MKKRKKPQAVSEQLRAALLEEESLYRASKNSGVALPQITQFVNDERSLTLRTVDRLCESLGLELVRK